jgi:hypothetical protein
MDDNKISNKMIHTSFSPIDNRMRTVTKFGTAGRIRTVTK